MKRTFSIGGETVNNGQIIQLGIVVPDVDAAMDFYARNLRVGPFTCMRGFRAPDGWYRGGNEMPVLTLAHAYTGRLFVEIIQQHDETPSVYKEFIDKHGYGLHHYGIAIAPEDYDSALEHYYNIGFEDVFTDTFYGGVRIRYLGPKGEAALEKLRNESGAGYIECIDMTEYQEAFFAGMVEASLNWDGKTVCLED